MANESASPRIYVACLAAYNSGRLHGTWIDCEDKSASDIWAEINAMLASSPEPNVRRRKCECGYYQTDARPFRENADDCPECGEELPLSWFASAEEWAVHDHEGFGGMIKSEWPDIDEIAAMAAGLNSADRFGFLWLVNDRGIKPSDAVDQAEDVRVYQAEGVHDLAADYAQELASDCIENFDERASQWPFTCIDWVAAGRELVIGGDIELAEFDGERMVITNPNDF